MENPPTTNSLISRNNQTSQTGLETSRHRERDRTQVTHARPAPMIGRLLLGLGAGAAVTTIAAIAAYSRSEAPSMHQAPCLPKSRFS